MLDGLLGRSGFYSKSKSLIKQTRTRIDVVRRKRSATQKFLRKDIADLLANGLETNAYGRAEGLIAELILSSCYDFIDHVCEIILKHLLVLQKLRECPEDCREAIASIMFAAARFSDLPELRDLRDLFRERYGSSLECFANQKLKENITPKPPSKEKKVHLMQEIALELSIPWDSRSFEERMSNPSAAEQENRVVEAVQIGTSFNRKRLESVDGQHKLDRQREDRMPERDPFNSSSQHRQDPLPVKNGTNFPSAVDNELAEDIRARSMRKRSEDIKDGLKSNFRSSAIPPPYVKPRKSNHEADMGSKNAHLSALDTDENETLTFNPPSNGRRPENPHTQFNVPDQQNGGILPENEDGPGRFTEIYYKDDSTPRRRSHRKKHSRSKSGQDDKVNGEVGREEERVVRRISTSRRKHESRQGLQILFDDEHFKKDEDEKIIDKLLLHYSKKPSSSDPGKPRRKTKGEINDASKSPHHKTEVGTRVDEDSTPTTSRTMSLPPLQVTELEPKKVFARAASFQQDSPAKHVHPKLPDYDDLAATFAALRAKKGLVLVLLAELYCSLLLRWRKHKATKPSENPCIPQPQQAQDQSTPSPLTSFYCQGVLDAPRSFLFPKLPSKREERENHDDDGDDIEKQKHGKLHQFLRVQSPLQVGLASSSSPSPSYISVTKPHQSNPDPEIQVEVEGKRFGDEVGYGGSKREENLMYISNPIYDNDVTHPTRVETDTPFGTPDSSPSQLEGGGSLGGEEIEKADRSSSSSPSSLPVTPMKELPTRAKAKARCVILKDARSLGTSVSGDSASHIGKSSSSSDSPRTSPSW
ncbi:hypothetical protein Cgig2_018653 [Carnegiea gigantea]|uniref:IST1-like protein n=1 Tax=Carnegiea gigantea TaxID=171969 RepID=A0A9Q1KGM7_9CARY|nr:hypothetical protein Cgig2_018653 [Carnegiea gigantea]